MIYFLSTLLAIAALTILIVFATINGTPAHIVGFSIFGSSLVLFYLIRGVFSLTHHESSAKAKLQKLDHVMIYIITAATYTPVSLLLPSRGWGWSVFGVVWGLVILASIFRILEILSSKIVTIGLYSSLLILDLIAFGAVHDLLTPGAMFWLTIGGLCYIAETFIVVHRPQTLLLRIFKSHETLALPLVLLGSFSHFWAMFRHIL